LHKAARDAAVGAERLEVALPEQTL
jgi:hypothetical protein